MSFTKFDRTNKKIQKKFTARAAANAPLCQTGKTFPNILIRAAPGGQIKKTNKLSNNKSLVALNPK